VGIGEDGYDGLNAGARDAIASAALLYGGARHLALVPAGASAASRICWPSPMASAVQQILTGHRGRCNVTVLASGDPMLYGIGATLTRDLITTEFRVIPQVSSFSLVCARLGWPAADTALVSLVNRPIQHLLRHLYPGQRLVLFSEDGNTPAAVAHLLTQHGYGPSSLTVFESIGGPSERKLAAVASAWPDEPCSNLNLTAVLCTPGEAARTLSLVSGLADEAFDADGQLTKREVRAVSIARLAPMPNQTLWDVGAGNGSIGIEWMRAHASCACISFELREDRAARIRENADRLGVPHLRVIHGPAPQTFSDLPGPDAIFLGGSVATETLFDACWEKLRSGGRLVANAVTLESEARLIARHAIHGGDLMRMMVARAEPVGRSLGWRPMMPITQWTVTKP
jgi:precorrin-6Y C5,15-methyltransferase (decarboxylating)